MTKKKKKTKIDVECALGKRRGQMRRPNGWKGQLNVTGDITASAYITRPQLLHQSQRREYRRTDNKVPSVITTARRTSRGDDVSLAITSVCESASTV